MSNKVVLLKDLIAKSCKNTPKLKCELVAVVDKAGRRIEFPDYVEAIIKCESR